MELHKLIRYTFLFCSIGTLAACSSADSGTATTPAVPVPVTISGSIFASYVNTASVTVKDSNGNTVAGPVTTASDGTYSIDILDTDLATDLVFESTGGEFTDEATGDTNVAAGAMSAFVAGGTLASGDSVHVTPGTCITSDLVSKHNMTPTQAQNAFFGAFAYNPDSSVEPVDPTDPASLNADDASKHIGWRAAVFSKLAMDLPLTPAQQFDMFAALAQDLSDSKLDGVDASGAVDIGTTGTTLPADILNQYLAATGSFTTAETTNYQVTYTPPTMNVHGKNQFTLTVMDTSGGAPTPATGLTDLQVMPMMYMADRTHSTPMIETITESAPGIYDVTVYYLMPSRMMDGTTMGTWKLKVMIGMKSVNFYPNINMAMMANTVRVQLKGVNDKIIDMNGLEVPRTYNLFREDLHLGGGPGNHQFDIFIAPMETMMSFPPLIVGDTLASGMGGAPYDVTSVNVDVNVNDTGWMTNQDTNTSNGIWLLSGLTLNSGANEIRVRLNVSSETKTTDGRVAVPDVNDFATFTVTLP